MTTIATTNLDRVRDHLCNKGIFGDVAEFCEMRGDCVYIVVCPDCQESFTLTDEEYDDLLHWCRSTGASCGVTL